MNEAKLDAIKEAWSEYWDEVKDRVRQTGHVSLLKIFGKTYDEEKFHYTAYSSEYDVIPKKLIGLKENNGWLRIDEHGLPTEPGKYICYTNAGRQVNTEWFNCKDDKRMRAQQEDVWIKSYTHYQPVKELKPPIY